MARFTYIEETDSEGLLIGTTLLETGGYFAGYSPAQLESVAEAHYPKYSHGNLSETFWHIYFNHTLREKLNGTHTSDSSIGRLSDSTQLSDSMRSSETGRTLGNTREQPEEGNAASTGD